MQESISEVVLHQMMVDQAEDTIVRLRAVADDLERYLDSFHPPAAPQAPLSFG